MGDNLEQKKISAKWIGIIGAAVVVVVVVAALIIMHFSKKEDFYRSIQIYDLEGTATIEREGIGTMNAVLNLYLESGDRICVGEDSFMRLKLDDDKYIMVEENSVLSIVAEGTKEDSLTSIHLEKGAITNEIQNKLNEKSAYDVTTPNSVMAVRGTVFRVEVIFDENGEVYTKVSTFEGKVGTRLVFPDGTIKKESVMVEGGKEVTIHMDDEKSEYLSDPQDIHYDELPLQAIQVLKDIMENGTNLVGISLEEINKLIQEKTEKDGQEQTEEMAEEEEPDADEKPEEDNEEDNGEQNDEDQQNDDGGQTGGNNQDDEADPQKPTVPKSYTVTFTYDGAVFATQTVVEGSTVNVPKLLPSQTGAWDFDFTKAITEDIIIEWK